jgi:hypothetical protein
MLIFWGICCPRFVNVHFLTIVNIRFVFSYSLLATWCPLLLGIGCLMSTIVCHHLLFLPITYHCCLSPTTTVVGYHKVLLFEVFASCHWWLLHAIVKGPCATPFPFLVFFIIGCCCCVGCPPHLCFVHVVDWNKWSSFNLQPQTTNKVSFTFFFNLMKKNLFFFLSFSYSS